MCGRFNLSTPSMVLARAFGLIDIPHLEPRFNVAPSQPVLCIHCQSPTMRIAEYMQWGLIPAWAKDPAIGSRLINARSETAHEKPSFRHAFQRRRCLIPLDGFYEWKKLNADEKFRFGGAGKKGITKQPVNIRLNEVGPFALAGLYEFWEDPAGTGTALTTCAILTTKANTLLKPIHDRMPVIIRPEQYERWLTIDTDRRIPPDAFDDLWQPYSDDEMNWSFVSRQVNDVRCDTPECTQPIDFNDNGISDSLFA